ncbi:hypothetical protein ACL1BF_13335 [Corynebacterium striatum]
MATLMSIPGYRRLVGTMAFNQTGYAMASVIVPLLILDISKNATLAGSVSAFGTGSLILLSLFAGALTDKFHPSVVKSADVVYEFFRIVGDRLAGIGSGTGLGVVGH